LSPDTMLDSLFSDTMLQSARLMVQ
jgi:hypothetical protein